MTEVAAQILSPLSIALVVIMAIVAGLKVTIGDVLQALSRRRLMLRGLVASFVLMPLVTILLLWLFRAPPPVAAAFLTVSVCAGAPFSVAGTSVAKGDVPYAIGLMVVCAALSVVVSPFLLAFLLAQLPDMGPISVDYFGISKVLFFSQILPLAAALCLHHFQPGLASHLVRPAELLQNILVLSVIVAGVGAQYRHIADLSLWAFFGMLLLLLTGTSIGWLLGGPEKTTRKALAFSTPQRNTGIAMVIASANFAGTLTVAITIVIAIFLALSAIAMQFILRRL